MDAGVSRRIGLAAAVTAAAVATSAFLIVLARPAASGVPADSLLPDLAVERPAELFVVKHRKLRIRVSNTVSNKGTGPLEISGDGSPCDSGDGRATLQTVFQDDPGNPGSAGYFFRAHDTDSESFVAGCSRFHPAHNHWHFDNFARYTLLRERTGRVVGGSRKVSFCVIDTGRPYPELDGSPSTAYYPKNDPGSFGCSETSTNGLSIGWEDTYGASLPGQAIRVRNPKRARYCLVLETDPGSPGDPAGQLLERNELNNTRTIKFALRPRKETLRRLGRDCRSA